MRLSHYIGHLVETVLHIFSCCFIAAAVFFFNTTLGKWQSRNQRNHGQSVA